MPHRSEQQNNIQSSFDLTLKDSNLEGLSVDIGEFAIESLTDVEVIKDLPVVGIMVKLTKFGANIRDHLFLKKIISFLIGLNEIPVDKRKKMIEKIDGFKKYRVKVGEKLLYIIDSCDDYETSELVSKVFKAFVEEKITYDEFLKTASVLSKLNISDFKWFIKNGKAYFYDLDDVNDMINNGLFNIQYDDVTVQVKEKDHFDPPTILKPEKYKAEVNGGVCVVLSDVGEIIIQLFSPKYKDKIE